MKKLLLLGCIFVISFFSTSCNYNQVEDKVVITKNDTGENNISGMGIDYQIKNITKGKYNVSLYSKEFKKGNFEKEERLYNTTLTFDKNVDKINLSIYQENENIKVYIGDSDINTITSDFFKNTSGIALFGLDTEKEIIINNELPIIGYIIGDDVKNVQSTNIDEIFKHKSTGEIVIYLKISDTK
ncbi:hypothetical protein K0040_07005 [Terrisporobacter petrolearius]|uniref:hypothetical protein n=1 Tax=Terrisporobacter petrolearius TaxID=1460447 RepID=UPI001D15E526|nr:hypothetical protein [Terrisporobacter petrolearius]MCC3864062.1 hypothetical protein [Terrisporobacter petrolearius]